MGVRVHLLGQVSLESDSTIVPASALPGRQGRLALAYLALARQPVERETLADVVWPDELSRSWERDLSAVISKLKAPFAEAADVLAVIRRHTFPMAATSANCETAVGVLATLVAACGTPDEASAIYDECAPYDGTWVGDGSVFHGSWSQLLGQVAGRAGRRAQAVAHLRAAIVEYERERCPALAARARINLALLDVDDAADLAASASRAATELTLPELERDAAALLSRLD